MIPRFSTPFLAEASLSRFICSAVFVRLTFMPLLCLVMPSVGSGRGWKGGVGLAPQTFTSLQSLLTFWPLWPKDYGSSNLTGRKDFFNLPAVLGSSYSCWINKSSSDLIQQFQLFSHILTSSTLIALFLFFEIWVVKHVNFIFVEKWMFFQPLKNLEKTKESHPQTGLSESNGLPGSFKKIRIILLLFKLTHKLTNKHANPESALGKHSCLIYQKKRENKTHLHQSLPDDERRCN